MESYADLQQLNKARKKRLLEYAKRIDMLTKNEVSTVVNQLVEVRKNKGMSQQDIADVTGIAAPNVARLESCRTIPTFQVLKKYANAVNMDLEIRVKPQKKGQNAE